MSRLTDADVVIKHIEEYWEMVKRGKPSRGMTAVMQNIKTIVNSLPTVDAVPLDGSFLKMSKGDYLIYNRHWLYEHFDQEMDIQRSAMKSIGYEYVGKNTDAVCHGKWEPGLHRPWKIVCSECGFEAVTDADNNEYLMTDYCPNCGAYMKGTEDD